MHSLLLVTFILQIAKGGIISSDLTGDWARDALDSKGKPVGRVTWRITLGENYLTLVESYQGEQMGTVTYSLDGTQIEESVQVPDWLSRDVLRLHRLKIKNANELELTKVYKATVIIETLTLLSRDILKVVRRMRHIDDRSPTKPPEDVIYLFHKVTGR